MIIHKPDSEGWIGRYPKGSDKDNTFENYQLREYNAAMSHVKRNRVAIDLGGNLGIMSYRMVKDFEFVHTFEPLFSEYLVKNVPAENIKIYPYAVGEKEKTVIMRIGHYHSGGSNIVDSIPVNMQKHYKSTIQVVTLDSYEFEHVDFIKIDVEKYEWNAIRGAKNTIEWNRPTLLIEINGPDAVKIFSYFESIHYTHQPVGETDYVFTPMGPKDY
jgi:FkbM family methyltransferase